MAEDNYSRLLHLPPEPRPLNPYQLLGVADLSDDEDAIRQAARRRLHDLVDAVGGPDNDAAIALVAEIGDALRTLTDADLKRACDEPIRRHKWQQFVDFGREVSRPGEPLTQAARRRWVETGLSLGLPWQDIYRHVDEVAARHAPPSEAAGRKPAGRANVSLDEADRIFRCLALGVEICSQKSELSFRQLSEAGARLGLPEAAQADAVTWAADLGPARWQVPLPAGAVAVDRERAFEFVVRGALFARMLSPADEARLQEVGLRAGLVAEAARHILRREMQRGGVVQLGELESEANAMAAIGPGGGEPLFAEAAPYVSATRDLRRRRFMVVSVIAVLVAGIVWMAVAFVPRWLGREPAEMTPTDLTPQELAAAERQKILSSIPLGPEQRLAREAMDAATPGARRLEAIAELGGTKPDPAVVQAVGWITRNDLDANIRIAAVEALGRFPYAASRDEFLRLVNPFEYPKVSRRAGDLLAREPDAIAAKALLARLAANDPTGAELAGEILQKMSGLELISGSLNTREGRTRLASLVARWIAADRPPPGAVWEKLPGPLEVMQMSDVGHGSPRQRYEVRLVEVAAKGYNAAWDLLVEVLPMETSDIVRQAVVDKLLTVDSPESMALQVMLLDRMDDDRTAGTIRNLIARGKGDVPRPPAQITRLVGILGADRYRAWFRAAYPQLAGRWAEALAAVPPQVTFEAAASLLGGPAARGAEQQVAFLAGQSRGGDFVASSLLVMLLRGDLGPVARDEARRAVAELSTRQAWFFVVDEQVRSGRLPESTEADLRRGALKDILADAPAYADDSISRFLAWQYYYRFGLDHLDRLADRPFLLSRVVAAARLPVLVPTRSPGAVNEAALEALALYGRMSPESQSAARGRLTGYAVRGDAVAARLEQLIQSSR